MYVNTSICLYIYIYCTQKKRNTVWVFCFIFSGISLCVCVYVYINIHSISLFSGISATCPPAVYPSYPYNGEKKTLGTSPIMKNFQKTFDSIINNTATSWQILAAINFKWLDGWSPTNNQQPLTGAHQPSAGGPGDGFGKEAKEARLHVPRRHLRERWINRWCCFFWPKMVILWGYNQQA